jgi:hypothetical protein
VKYSTPAAFRTALEQRLLSRSNETGIPLVRLRKLVVFDRLMARLMIVAPEYWTLKGAVALLFRAGPTYRTTRDIDFGRREHEQAATEDFIAVQSLEMGDYFSFAIERIGPNDLDTEGPSVRYRARAELAGRLFENITIDVGFAEPIFDSVDIVRGPDLLSFADIQPVEVPAVSLAQHVAEKVHAYTRIYEGGRPSSRVKDLLDLGAIASLFDFDASQLRRALESVFSARATYALPSALPPPPNTWRVPYRTIAREMDLDPNLSVGYDQARAFLNPILIGSTATEGRWDPEIQKWS